MHGSRLLAFDGPHRPRRQERAISQENSIRILVADDHHVTREGLVAFLNRIPGLVVIAEAATGKEAVELHARHSPDVSLIDLCMPEMDGLDALRTIHERDASASIVILTTFEDDEAWHRGMRAGARAFLLKDVDLEELVECIRAVHAGKVRIPPSITDILSQGSLKIED